MWSYYGSKSKIIDYYPPPKYGKIIEPFAGTARYALKYFDRDVLLVDKYEVVIRIWKWLQVCSPKDIRDLPHFVKETERVSDFHLCEEAYLLMGFLVSKASQCPRNKPTFRATTSRPNNINYQLKYIEKSLPKIKHWTVELNDYKSIPNQEATWFIDPPYQVGGYVYVENKIDYEFLRNWCRSRNGQAIVCENTKADWMNFKPMRTMAGSIHTTTEAIWSNFPTEYDYLQPTLIVV
jgi:site-specific DNA-adenine methylase